MTSRQTIQQESDLQAKIKEKLMSLKQDYGFNGRRLAERLGMNENFLSRVINGKSDGSKQLLAGLSILIELETLKKEAEDVRAAKRAIQQLMAPSAAMLMNEPGKSAPEAPGIKPVSYHVPPVHVKFGVEREAASEARQKPSKKGGGAKA